MNYMELLNVTQIASKDVIPFGIETVRRYFRKHILYAHAMENNSTYQSYKGSVLTRYMTLQKVKVAFRDISLDEIGRLFRQASGEADEFIVDHLKNGSHPDELANKFFEEVKKHARPTGSVLSN